MTTEPTSRHERGTAPPVSLGFRYGWCTLTLSGDGATTSIKATKLGDAFTDLVRAVVALLEGSAYQCVSWCGEGSGWFVGLSAIGDGGVGVAVHTMQDPNWLLGREPWRPVQGELAFAMHVPFDRFMTRFANEMRRTELSLVDATGYMPHWGWKFPRVEFAELERRTIPLGYRPRTLEEYEVATNI